MSSFNYLDHIRHHLINIHQIVEELRTPEICEIAVMNNGHSLMFVPHEYRTKELCNLAFSGHLAATRTSLLREVPPEHYTKGMFNKAVEQSPDAFNYIPKEHTTSRMYIKALQSTSPYMKLKNIPKTFWTEELLIAAVKAGEDNIDYISKQYLTRKICVAIVKRVSHKLSEIPKQYITEGLILSAMKRSPYCIIFAPVEMRTRQMYKIAFSDTGSLGLSLNDIPVKLRTQEVCDIAVSCNGENLEFVPKQYITKARCMSAVKQNVTAIAFVPVVFRTEEICKHAYMINSDMLMHIPNEMHRLFVSSK